jgi:hypothetical protein
VEGLLPWSRCWTMPSDYLRRPAASVLFMLQMLDNLKLVCVCGLLVCPSCCFALVLARPACLFAFCLECCLVPNE